MEKEAQTQAFTTLEAPEGLPESYHYPLSFTGSGSEYFKIWVVNVLLILITAGIYYPWAKLRKQKYLHRNLMLDGTAFDYQAKPKAMLLGAAVALPLYGVYFFIDFIDSIWIKTFVFIVISLIMPWMAWKALRFRMAVTKFKALSFVFTGSLKGSYLAITPQYIMIGLFTIIISSEYFDSAEIEPGKHFYGEFSNYFLYFTYLYRLCML